MQQVVKALAKDLKERGSVYLSECFIDGSFCMAKKGDLLLARLNAIKTPRSNQSASAHEVKMVENVLEGSFIEELPERLFGDQAYDVIHSTSS
jgi:hypothetical protein